MWKLAFLLFLGATPAWGQARVVAACGSANYSASVGTLQNLTMNTSGYLCATTTATVVEKSPRQQQQDERREPQK
jgi:hypothetical protein